MQDDHKESDSLVHMTLELTSSEREMFDRIGQVAESAGLTVYAIGGFIRDRLLGIPCKDIDFVTVGDGPALAEAVSRALGPEATAPVVYRHFGTAMLRYRDFELEFVGARKESYTPESRKPKVAGGTLHDDQCRRDFTINALAIPLNGPGAGEVLDPFDGLSDLAARRIVTPLDPDITFSDDPLRMLRAIRFATQLGFDIDPVTFDSITRMRERIGIVSMERISLELNKMISAREPSAGLLLLDKAGLLELILPEFVQLKGVDQQEGYGHKDNFYHTLQVLDNVAAVSDDLWLRWSAILHDIAKPQTKRFEPGHGWTFHGHEVLGAKMVPRIFRRLKLSMDEPMKYVQQLVRLHLRPIALVQEEITDAAIRRLLFDAGDQLDDLMILCKADITSKNPNRVARYLRNYDVVMEKLRDVEARDHLRNWQPPITGETIMSTFGIGPGRQVGEIKTAIREAILDGVIENDFDKAFAFMLEEAGRHGLEPVSR